MDARHTGGDGRWALPVAWAVLAAVLLSALPVAAGAAGRVALVIGNSAYEKAPFLENPRNDAKDVGAALDRLGFTVTRLADADQATLRQRLGDFTRAAGASEVAVVFYAGHGIEVDGRNFLVPVDASLRSDQDVEFETVPLELVMRSVERARGLRLVVLDACRDNPFAESMQRAGATRSIGRGLARAEPRGETLVAYAAKGGSTADDGDGRNSPYTGALLRYLEEPGLDVGRMFRKVRDEVLAATGGRQEPFVYGSMPGRDVYLASAATPPPPKTTATPAVGGTSPAPTSGDTAKAAYEAAERQNTVAAYRIVVEDFPGTTYAKLAQAWIDEHEQPIVVAGGDPEDIEPGVTPSPPSPEAVEQDLKLSGEAKRLVQMGLAAAGHDPGPADGVFGGRTRKALRAWQESKELEGTGYLTREQSEGLAGLGREAAERLRAEAERERKAREEERRRAEAERKAREVEERRRAEAERKAREAEEAARRARAAAERREREAKERRRAEAERRADDEAFARAKRLHTESGYRAYLARGGRRRHEAEARALLSKVTEPRWDVGEKFRDCPGCPEMVVVPEERFQMGSPESEAGRDDDEGPVHEVTIGRPFAVGVNEVTRGEFAWFVSATGRSMGDSCWTYEGGEWEERSGRHWRSPGFSQTDEHPVVCVDWNDAQAYVRWLSGETGEAYRLLSEAEWEYVARAGTRTARYWGESESGQCRYANGADRTALRHNSGWTTVDCDDGHYQTAPVGSFSANGFGLRDVLGNVYEWVEDCWNDSYAGAPRDGSAWTSGDCGRRVLRRGPRGHQPREPPLRQPRQGHHRPPGLLCRLPRCPDAHALSLYVLTSGGPGGGAPWSFFFDASSRRGAPARDRMARRLRRAVARASSRRGSGGGDARDGRCRPGRTERDGHGP